MEDLTLTDVMTETCSNWSGSERESQVSQALRSPGASQKGVRKKTRSEASFPSPLLKGRAARFPVSPFSTPPGSPSPRVASTMAAGMYLPNELPVTFDGHPHIMTDLSPNTTCSDLIQALLSYRALVHNSLVSPSSSPVGPNFSCLPTPAECDIFVVRHGERRRKVNRGVRIQTFYRHYVQRHSADSFYLEVCRKDGISSLTRRRNLNVCHACGNDDRVASPEATPVEFFDAEAARKAKEDAETRRQLLKTIDRQTKDIERLSKRLQEVDSEISEVEWKILPSRNLVECLAHYERLHRCNRRLLEEHAKIQDLTEQVEAARRAQRSGWRQAEEVQPLRRTFSASSVMDLAELAIPPPKAFDDCQMGGATYENFPMRRPHASRSQFRQFSIHSSQPLENCHQPIRSHGSSKLAAWAAATATDTAGADSDTGLGSLSDEAGCIGPVETLV